MSKFIKLSVFIIFSVLLVSCSNLYKEESDIIIDAGQSISRAIHSARTASPEEEAMIDAIENALEFEIEISAGVSGGYSTEVNRTYSYNYVDIDNIDPDDFDALTIPDIPVGSSVTVYAEIVAGVSIKNEEALRELARAFGEDTADYAAFSEDDFVEYFMELFNFSFVLKGETGPVTIHSGDNNITISMDWDDDIGNGEFGGGSGRRGLDGEGRIRTERNDLYTIGIKTPVNASKYYIDSEITFGLYDADGNDVSDAHYVDSGNWEYKLLYGTTEIPVMISGTPCWQYATSTFTLGTLPQSGIYQLYVQLRPFALDGENTELISAVFDIDYTKAAYYTFNVANLMDGYNASQDFITFIDGIQSDAFIDFTGEATEAYSNIFAAVNTAFDSFQYLVDLDFSKISTTADQKYSSSGYGVQNFTKLRSIIFPADLPKLAYADFSGCSHLESVTFGSGLKYIGEYGAPNETGAFGGLTSLSSVIIPSDSELKILLNNTFHGCTSLRHLELPESILMIGANAFDSTLDDLVLTDEGGNWYYYIQPTDSGDTYYTTFFDLANNLISGLPYDPEYQYPDNPTLDSWIESQANSELYDTLAKKIVYASSQGLNLYKMD